MIKKLLVLIIICIVLPPVQSSPIKFQATDETDPIRHLTPPLQISNIKDVWIIQNLEIGARLNIVSSDYSLLQFYIITKSEFNLSALELTKSSYIIQTIGDKTLSQQEIFID